MNKQTREITEKDIIPTEEYNKERKKIRKDLIEFKKKKKSTLRSLCYILF